MNILFRCKCLIKFKRFQPIPSEPVVRFVYDDDKFVSIKGILKNKQFNVRKIVNNNL